MALAQYPAHIDEKVKASFDQYSMEAMENSSINVLFNVWDSNDYSKGYTTIEGGTGVDYIGESENIDDVNISEWFEAVGTAREFAGKIRVTKKERLNANDETTLFNLIVDKKIPVLMSDHTNFVESQSMQLLNNGFTTELAPDGVTIFGTHSYKSTGATFDNASTTAAWEAALQELEEYAGDFKDAYGKPMPMSMTTLVVKKGGKASREFRKVLAGQGDMQASEIGNVNIYNNGTYTLIETPFVTSGDAWYAFDSRKDNALIVDFIQRPQLEERFQDPSNLDQITPSSASWRFGCYILPTMWYGSTGV